MARHIFIGLLALALIQGVYHYGNLPDVLATNFDASGQVNGTTSKSTMTLINLVIWGCVLGGILWVPSLMDKLPPELINLPNKAYWLQPENLSRLKELMMHWMYLLGCGLLVFELALAHLVYQANMTQTPLNMPYFWGVMGGFTLLVLVWSIGFILSFKQSGGSP